MGTTSKGRGDMARWQPTQRNRVFARGRRKIIRKEDSSYLGIQEDTEAKE